MPTHYPVPPIACPGPSRGACHCSAPVRQAPRRPMSSPSAVRGLCRVLLRQARALDTQPVLKSLLPTTPDLRALLRGAYPDARVAGVAQFVRGQRLSDVVRRCLAQLRHDDRRGPEALLGAIRALNHATCTARRVGFEAPARRPEVTFAERYRAGGPELRRALRLMRKAEAQEDARRSVALYERSVALHPTADALAALGWRYARCHRWSEAKVYTERAIRVDPGFGDSYNYMGLLLQVGLWACRVFTSGGEGGGVQ